MSVFAPLISHAVARENVHQAALMALIADAPYCTSQDTENTKPSQHHGDHSSEHDGMEACGYCNLLVHQPFLITTLARLDAVVSTNNGQLPPLTAAFQPHTVAAASRAQPPPTIV